MSSPEAEPSARRDAASSDSGSGSGRDGGSDDAKQHSEGRKSFVVYLALLVVLVGLAVTITGIVMTLTASGNALVRVPLTDTPQEAEFSTERDGVIEVWTDIELMHRGISYQLPNGDLPHVLDYVVEIEQAGLAIQSFRCNPFNSHFARTSYYGASGGVNGRSYDGRIKGCALHLAAGKYRVRAHKEIVKPDPRFSFKKTVLILRGV